MGVSFNPKFGAETAIQRIKANLQARKEAETVVIPLNVLLVMYINGPFSLMNIGHEGFRCLYDWLKPIDVPDFCYKSIPAPFYGMWSINKLAEILGITSNQLFWILADLTLYNGINKQKGDITAMTPHEEVSMKIGMLRENLLASTPQLPGILAQIKIYLSKNPEVVVLLSEDEIGEIVRSAQSVAQVKLVEKAASSKSKKALKDTELEDLM